MPIFYHHVAVNIIWAISSEICYWISNNAHTADSVRCGFAVTVVALFLVTEAFFTQSRV